jgi:hypothetical protein
MNKKHWSKWNRIPGLAQRLLHFGRQILPHEENRSRGPKGAEQMERHRRLEQRALPVSDDSISSEGIIVS